MQHFQFYISLLLFFILVSFSNAQPIPVSEQMPINASSNLPLSKYSNYEPKNVCDLQEETAWVEGLKGDGVGEWIAIFVGKYEEIKKLKVLEVNILPGYTKSYDSYVNNGKPQQLQIDLFLDNIKIGSKALDCPVFVKEETSDCYIHYFTTSIPVEKISATKGIVWMKVTIKKVKKGKKYDDTAISEIIFNLDNENIVEMKNTLNLYGESIKANNSSHIKQFTRIPTETIYREFNPLEFCQEGTKLSDIGKIYVFSNNKFIYCTPFTECGEKVALFEYTKGKWEIKKISLLSLY